MRKDFLVICIIMVLISITTIVFNQMTVSGTPLLTQLIRLSLTIFLGIYVVKNNKVAIGLMTVLCLLAGVTSIITILVSNISIVQLIPIMFMGLFYLFAGLYLILKRNRPQFSEKSSYNSE